MGHMSDTCTNRICYRLCFRSGHVKKDCPGINAGSTIWVPKVPSLGFEPCALTEPLPDASGSLPSPPTSTPSPQNQSAEKPQSPPPSPATTDTPSMAVYEHDPRRFLHVGHGIIDGGAERLPRTYYTLMQAPPRAHEQFMVAIVEPLPPAHLLAIRREQVLNFLQEDLQVIIRYAQTWF